MAEVKGPNGVVYELEDSVAASLVGKGNRGYEYVEDKAESKSTAKRSSSAKK